MGRLGHQLEGCGEEPSASARIKRSIYIIGAQTG
ncbi:hypothetical protein Hamer_G007196 [Homarus americanus]|uniref:Uncharacterized protein n=1 Tax=Homarus americanus TaxID=6706 RepID=A0A8J5JVS5_HOMAM|nr:hypothetical protein Hamer_G007196 [Homarus americanus]